MMNEFQKRLITNIAYGASAMVGIMAVNKICKMSIELYKTRANNELNDEYELIFEEES